MKHFLLLVLLLMVLSHQDQSSDEKVYEGKEVDTKVKVLSQPEAVYTYQAAREHVVGTVILIAVFTRSGEVRNIEVVNGLPAGLTENAIAVARRITFTPAMKDGHAVSQKMQLEYNFQLTERVIHGQHFPKLFYDESCRDYTNIAPNNMVFFTSEKEAKKAGYKKSKTCP